MEGQTRVVWDFLQTAFRTGALDELIKLSKALTDKKYENQALLFADLEDAVSEMENLDSVDQTLEEALRLMPALTDPETMEGIAFLLPIITPWLDSWMAAADRDTEVVGEKIMRLKENLPKVGKALLTLLAVGARPALSRLDTNASGEYGRQAGKTLNAGASWINDLHDREPAALSGFMAGAFEAVDGKQVTKATETLVDVFLDQRPPLLRWTAATMFRRAKRRLFGRQDKGARP